VKPLEFEDGLPEEPPLNLTPLIDVVFVVLISFMLIAPMLDREQVDLVQGGPQSSSCSSASPFAITVRSDNSIWLQGRSLSLTELAQQAAIIRATQPQTVPQLIHDRSAPFGTYQAIKNTLETAGFEQLDLVVQP